MAGTGPRPHHPLPSPSPTALDAAAVIRHHTPCAAYHDEPLCFGCGHQAVHPCEPYQLAVALRDKQERLRAVIDLLNDDNRLDQEHSVAALGAHVPKVRELFINLWKALR